MIRALTALTVLGTAAALVFGACDRRAERAGGASSITVVIAEYSKDHTRPFWQGLADQYSKQSGSKVDLRIIDWNSIDQQVSTMLQSNQPPDVLNLNSFSSYAKDQLLDPADDVLSPKTRERAFFYNKDLFARAGLAGPPPNWDEFLQAARKIQALGDGVIGYALPLGPEEAQAEWAIWMWNNGGDWKSGDAWAINSDKNVQTLQFLADLASRHRVTQVNPGKTNRTDGAFQLFKDGKVGMVMGFSPLAAQLDAEKKVSYGVVEMPTAVGQPVTLGVEDYLIVALTLMPDPTREPLTVGITSYVTAYVQQWNLLIAILPVVILFATIERHLVGGLTAGSVK